MQLSRHALLCSSLLLATPWLAAQALSPVAIPSSSEQTIQIAKGTTVRIWPEGGRVRSALTRDAGKSWSQLRDIENRIATPWQTFDPLAGEPAVPALLPTPAANQLRIVQSWSQILPEYRQAIEALGIEIYNYLPEQGYLVRMDAQKEAQLRALPWVRWVGEWKLAYKLDRAIVDDMLAGKELPATRLVVMLFDRFGDRAALARLIEEVGGTIDILGGQQGAENCLLEATLTGAQMMQVAAANTVVWIERWTKPELDMDNARAVSGANYIQAQGGFTGKGVRGHIMEGIQATHPEFVATPPHRATPIGIWNTTADAHGCATFGEVFSKGIVAQARGMCPDGQGLFTNYNYVINNTGTGAGTRTYVTQQLTDSAQSYKAMQQTASWGYGQNVIYDARAVEMDLGIFTYDFPTTQSQSNTGNQTSRPQAWAKNIISVGAHYHYDNQNWADDRWSSGGSTGPAPDGRIKPDIAAFYDATYTTYSTTSGYSASFGGTSGATPMCNGMMGLAQEMYTDGIFGQVFAQTGWQYRFQNRAHFTTMKALMINTARQYDPTVNTGTTRYNQGWGYPQLNTMYDERARLLVLNEEDTLSQGQTRSYWVWAPGSKNLRATMVFADPPGTASVNPNRVNDLSMKVTTQSGVVYHGNVGLTTALYSSPGGVPNTLDTVENVYLQNAPRGWYQIDVNASLVAVDAHKETAALDADFALVVSGIGGLRDTTGMKLALGSTSTGDFRVDLTGLPASYAEGYTLFSATTPRPVSLGNLFGLEFDGLTLGCFTSAVGTGNVFHFTPSTTSYPGATFAFPAALASALTGITFDAVALTLDTSANINAVSNVARVKLQ